jgi:hypothetical protein
MIEITYDSSRLMTCFDPGLKQYWAVPLFQLMQTYK